MAVGLSQDKGSIDSWSYQVAMGLEQAFKRAQELQAFIAAEGSTNLQALGYSAGDVANLTSAINDAVTLANIYNGTTAQGATAYNFGGTFLKLLRGTSCW